VQLKSFLPHSSRLGPGVAPGEAGAIVAANTRKLRDARLDQTPVKRKVAGPRNQDDRWGFVAGAVQVQSIAAYIDQLAGRWGGLVYRLRRGNHRAQDQKSY